MTATALGEKQRIHRAMSDLVGLTALSAIWFDQEPARVAEDLAEVLLRVLDLEFALVRLKGTSRDTHEVVRTAQRQDASVPPQAISQALAVWLDAEDCPPPSIADPTGGGRLHLLTMPVGCYADGGVFVAGSREPEFPRQEDHMLISVALNQASAMLQRERAAAAIRETEITRLRLAAIVESCEDAVISKDLEGVIESWNPGAERLYGYRAEEVIGKQVTLLIPPEHPDEFPMIMERLKRGERIEHFDAIRVRKDGRRIQVSVSISPIKNAQGRVVGASAIARDVSQRRQVEESLKEADRRKTEFLAMLGHELRTPLAAIYSANEALGILGSKEEKPRQLCAVISRQLNHVTRMVDDLLDISRISRGKVQLERVPTEVATIVRQAVETTQPLFDARKHALSVSLPQEPVVVKLDPVRMTQVIANLLNNAAKYTDPGGRIELSAQVEAAELVISVRDSGIGIAPEMLPQVFEAFTQADRSVDRSQGGLGIGLSLVRSLVEMHGGTIRAGSAGLGQGSEFVVRLPRLEEPSAGPAPARTARALPRTPASRRVLIVDDNYDVADTLAMILRFEGHEVRTGHNGPDALEMAATFRPEVILMDIGLPGMTGYEVARRVRANPALSSAYLVAISGYGQEDDRLRALESGFDSYVVKPIGLETLESLVARQHTPNNLVATELPQH